MAAEGTHYDPAKTARNLRSPIPVRVPHPVSCNVNKAYSFIIALRLSAFTFLIQRRDPQVVSKQDPCGNVNDVRRTVPEMREKLEGTCTHEPDTVLCTSAETHARSGLGTYGTDNIPRSLISSMQWEVWQLTKRASDNPHRQYPSYSSQ